MSASVRSITVASWVPRVSESWSESTRRGWSTYARLLVEEFGDRTLDDVDGVELRALARRVRANAIRRAVHRDGASAEEGFIACARSVWRSAVPRYASHNPAADLKPPPRRAARERRALTTTEVERIWSVLSSRPSDPVLAGLVFRLALETGFRRQEMLSLTVGSLVKEPTFGVRVSSGAKNASVRTQPVTGELWSSLREFAAARHPTGTTPGTSMLCRRDGVPITRRWFERTADIVRRELPELGEEGSTWFSWHLCRHTAATLVERQAGFALAKFFLGHAGSAGGVGVTLGYVKPSYEELATVIERIWGLPAEPLGDYYPDGR